MIDGLRDYQESAVKRLYDWMDKNNGNPCLVAPTGSGKSWIIAALCQDAIAKKPTARVIVLSHMKELLAQDAEKLLLAWPSAPIGIYSAGLKSKEINQITVAGIQSIYRHAAEVAPVDLVIVDEAHLINSGKTGMYRSFLGELKELNAGMRVIGLTATPYRLGQGLLTEGEDALFQGLVDAVSVDELLRRGFLSPLRSKLPQKRLELEGVHTRGGEYIEKDLQAAVDTEKANADIASEIVKRGTAEGRRSWIVFCTGVDHADHMRAELQKLGIKAATVTGKTPQAERDMILQRFKNGEITAVTNANVLTTGFDAPGVDLIAFCRPTLSPGLYVQMAGRGMRTAEGKKDCLVLDFGGNVMRHGPITHVTPPSKKGSQKKAPSKACPNCGEIVVAGTRVCPVCGYEWPAPERKQKDLYLDGGTDIMGREMNRTAVSRWYWYVQKSKSSGVPMLVVDYQPAGLTAPPLREYLCLMHGGYAERRSFETLHSIMKGSGLLKAFPRAGRLSYIGSTEDLHKLAAVLSTAMPPSFIEWKKDGKFTRVTGHEWPKTSAVKGGGATNENADRMGQYSTR